MRVVKNYTETFIATLKRQARKTKYGKNAQGKRVVTGTEVLDTKLEEVFKHFNTGKIKFQNHCIEAAAIGSGLTTVKFLDESDTKITGVRSIANAKLPDGEFFCPVEIQVLGADLATDDMDGLKSAKWDVIDNLASGKLMNGDITYKVNNNENLLSEKPLIGWTGLSQSNGATRKGAIVLDNTTIMKPQLRVEIETRSAIALPAKTGIKVVAYGTRTTPVGR